MLAKTLTAGEIARAVQGQLHGGEEKIRICDIVTDSRAAGEDTLYIPIVGERFDGHDFIAAAKEKGAALILSHREINPEAGAYILVEDTRRALMDLAAYYRSLFAIPAVAVTGSVGKTSVKNRVAAVLSEKYRVLKTEGNYNNEIGLPLTVFQLTEAHEVAVFEMGMNSFGEISNLSKIARPALGLITNVGTAHIERLGDRQGILKAKLELTDGMEADGRLILNHDNDMLAKAGETLSQSVVWISTQEALGVYAGRVAQVDGGFAVDICYGERKICVHLAAGETPLVQNALMAAAVGFLMDLSDEQIRAGIEREIEEKGRLLIRTTAQGVKVIDDCYNANADSMRLGLDILKRDDGYRVAVLGDMLELGEMAEQFHRAIGEYAAQAGIDELIAIGNDAQYYHAAFEAVKGAAQKSSYYATKADFFSEQRVFVPGTTVLVKASRGMRLEDVVENILR